MVENLNSCSWRCYIQIEDIKLCIIFLKIVNYVEIKVEKKHKCMRHINRWGHPRTTETSKDTTFNFLFTSLTEFSDIP